MMKQNVKRIISQLVSNLDIPRSGKSLDEDDSWYLTVSNGSYQNVEIRISNHKTDINTWAFRQYRGQSPSTRISIVFRDNNYAGNVLLHEPVRRQISVTEYVYDLTDGSTLSDKEIAMLTKAIRAAASGSFVDPLGMSTESDVVGKYVAQNTTTTNNGNTVPSTKWNHGMDSPIEESKTNKNMKKNVVKLNENTLRKIVAESVKKVLKEYGNDDNSPIWNDSPQSGYEEFTKWGERAAYLIMTEINNKRNEYAEDLFDKEGIRCMCDGFKRGLEDMIENGIINPWATEYEGKIVYNKNGHPWKVNR